MIGGHLARKTWLHSVPARVKLVALAPLTIAAFYIDDPLLLGCGLTIVLAVYLYLGPEARVRLASLTSLIPFLAVIALFQFWSLGIEAASAIVFRLCLMILLADMVSMTTPMLDMMDAIEPVLRPLSMFGLDGSRMALAVALVVRFVPALVEEWSRRSEAWRARTGRRASIRLLPAFLGGIVIMADRIAEALDSRGFNRQGKH